MLDRKRFAEHGEKFTQRITEKEWSKILLNHEDTITCRGRTRQLLAKDLGYGVIEVYMKPLGIGDK